MILEDEMARSPVDEPVASTDHVDPICMCRFGAAQGRSDIYRVRACAILGLGLDKAIYRGASR